ncbi:LysR substrate-binding domain-containing protein [Bosea sp. (in: a-proteobacteria)]|uniref:LysR substrate-binding domain-containing protein n=1 Tax=Bosea sp. (in: a-proteobacteria) TaxID=1871050 RepID=UPI00262AFD8A|nr:LysR substrate-binding domain-containing protein [Bosea sp. (in: a-proteobacteria)]MCO5091432.1 LysR substrate-binding domain-containing protein [Bosea sp. (in: a-proteobacteria)]
MDIAQLKTLIHVAELGSLSRASERLHIVQPALSRQIRQLESELGVQLFERHGRGMVITDIGREVLEHASRILAEMEAIRSATGSSGTSLRGTVKVGTTPTVAEIVTVPLVSRLRETHPQLGIRLASAFSGHLLDWLQRGELELAVSYDPKPQRSLRIVPVMLEELMLVSAGRGELPIGGPRRFSDLVNVSLILPSPHHGLRMIVDECARQVGISLRAQIEADSFGAMIDLVRNGFGSTVLPLAPIYGLVQAGSVHAYPLVDPTPSRRLVLAYPADRPISPAARFVGETFTQIAADLVRRDIWIGRVLSGI